MKQNIIKHSILVLIVLIIGIFASIKYNNVNNLDTNTIEGIIITKTNNTITLKDNNNTLYTFNYDNDIDVGDTILLEYIGLLDNSKSIQYNKIVSTKIVSNVNNTGIFDKYYEKASNKVSDMTLDEKIEQLLLVRYNSEFIDGIGGYIFYSKDFKDKNETEVKKMISNLQNRSNIPLLIAVDEEGGTVVRVSSNPKLRSSIYLSPKEIYDNGGMEAIRLDTIDKSNFLNKFGINVNLAPVVDIADNPDAYIYNRTIGYNKEITSEYAKTVINASKDSKVSYVLKHFPGYGNNTDTHISSSIDTRSYNDIMDNDIIPFKEGIDSGAEAVLISHNIITNIDSINPASLSSSIHNILTNDLSFTGIIITDDLDMGATKDIENRYIKAIKAGNDIIIISDYESAKNEIKSAIENNIIDESIINEKAIKVIAWKYYKGLINDNDK